MLLHRILLNFAAQNAMQYRLSATLSKCLSQCAVSPLAFLLLCTNVEWISVKFMGGGHYCQVTTTSLGNSGLCWTIFARNRDTAVPAEGNGNLQTLICVLVARLRRCLTLSNPVPWQNWMAAYLSYTLRMRTLFRGWPVMVNHTHTRRRKKTTANKRTDYVLGKILPETREQDMTEN